MTYPSFTPAEFTIIASIGDEVWSSNQWSRAVANWLEFLGPNDQVVLPSQVGSDVKEAIQAVIEVKRREQAKIAQIYFTSGGTEFRRTVVKPYALHLSVSDRVVPTMRKAWISLVKELERSPKDGFHLPLVDIVSIDRYEPSESGFRAALLHKNSPDLRFGPNEPLRRSSGEPAQIETTTLPVPSRLLCRQLEGGEIPFVFRLHFEEDPPTPAPVFSHEPRLPIGVLHSLPSWRTPRR